MFIQTQDTPNPRTLKFLPGHIVSDSGNYDFPDLQSAQISPLAQQLFTVEGVERIFLGSDFISITRTETSDWILLKPSLLSMIMEHFTKGAQTIILTSDKQEAAKPSAPKDEISHQIAEIINVKVRPAIAQDGGDITFERFEDGIVYVHLKGACAGCPSSTLTLKSGIENLLKHYVPEVIEVRQHLD